MSNSESNGLDLGPGPLVEPPANGEVHSRWHRWAPAVVLVAGLGITFLGAEFTQGTLLREDEARFERLVDRAEATIVERLEDHDRALAGISGLLVSQPQLGPREFARYASQLRLEDFPGALGFGFIRRVPHPQIPAYLAGSRVRLGPDFALSRLSGQPEHAIVEFIEPLAANRPARGLDISWEANWREAAAEAVERNAATLSRRVTLVQDQDQIAGFLMLRPVYASGATPASTPERWRDLSGWAYIPIRIDALLAGVAASSEGMVDIEIYEDDPTHYDRLLFDEDGHLAGRTGPVDESLDRGRRFRSLKELSVSGRTWFLRAGTNSGFDRARSRIEPVVVFLGGLLVSLLAAMLAATSARVVDKARRLAETMTLHLRESEARTLEALRKLEQQKAALDEHAIVAVTDTEGTIRYVNDRFCAISGYTRAELLGQTHRLVNSGTHPKAFFREMYQTIAGGHPWHGDICNRAKDGHLYWEATTIVPFLDRAGRPVQYVALHTDITAQKRAEAELARHRDHLQELVDLQTASLVEARDDALAASRAKSAFLTNMSHELRTPMHGILSYAQLGRQRVGRLSPEKQEKYFSGIVTSAKELMTLIDDLLDLSHLGAHKVRFDLRPAELGDIVRAAATNFSGLAAERRLEVVAPEGPLRVLADAPRIGRVLAKLLDNAGRFSPADKPIRIQLHVPEESATGGQPMAQVDVEDQGVGIPDEELQAVFEQFVESSRTRSGAGGTGVGLPIARMIVEAHGGVIWAWANPEGGTILSFRLPLARIGVPAAAGTL